MCIFLFNDAFILIAVQEIEESDDISWSTVWWQNFRNPCKIFTITYINPEQAPNGECWKETRVSLHSFFSFLTSDFPFSVCPFSPLYFLTQSFGLRVKPTWTKLTQICHFPLAQQESSFLPLCHAEGEKPIFFWVIEHLFSNPPASLLHSLSSGECRATVFTRLSSFFRFRDLFLPRLFTHTDPPNEIPLQHYIQNI